jgi:DNA-binding LytR/AlgR family response regulator
MSLTTQKCLIVDDEQGGHLVLQNYINRMDSLELAGHCYSAMEAINFLNQNQVDILFLDIQMPEMTGLELLQTMTKPPKVILCTAYTEFALSGYEFGVSDYLVKPIPFPRFLKAVSRILEEKQENLSNAGEITPALPEKDHIFIQIENEQVKFEFAQIKYIQSYGNYVRIYTQEKMYLANMTTQDLESQLPINLFLRVHKSFIVSLKHITKVGVGRLFIGNIEIPIGTTFRQKVADRF